MASYRINDAELDALSGEGADLFQLYVGAIRPRMDYKTGVVGRRVRLSYQALKEWTERAGRSGVRFLAHDKSKIQRMLARLEHLGLLRKVGRRGDLVFACPLADTDSRDQKQADTESIQVDRPVKPKPRKASRDLSTRRKNRQADTHQVSGKTLNPTPPTPSRLRRDGDGEIDPPTPAAREEDSPDATPIGTHAQQLSEQRHEPAKRGGRGPSARRSDEEVAADIAFEKHLKWPRGLPHHQRAFIARTSRDLGPVLAQRVLDEWHGAKQAGIVGRDWPYFNSLVRAAKEQGDAWETVYAEQVAADREHALQQLAAQAAREQQFGAEIGGKAGPLPPGGLSRLARTLLRRGA